MKEYTLKFGMHYARNIWHVICQKGDRLESNCKPKIHMGFSSIADTDDYIYPISEENYGRYGDQYKVDFNLNYNRLCLNCKKKFQLTKEDINHYIVLAKLGIKI